MKQGISLECVSAGLFPKRSRRLRCNLIRVCNALQLGSQCNHCNALCAAKSQDHIKISEFLELHHNSMLDLCRTTFLLRLAAEIHFSIGPANLPVLEACIAVIPRRTAKVSPSDAALWLSTHCLHRNPPGIYQKNGTSIMNLLYTVDVFSYVRFSKRAISSWLSWFTAGHKRTYYLSWPKGIQVPSSANNINQIIPDFGQAAHYHCCYQNIPGYGESSTTLSCPGNIDECFKRRANQYLGS